MAELAECRRVGTERENERLARSEELAKSHEWFWEIS